MSWLKKISSLKRIFARRRFNIEQEVASKILTQFSLCKDFFEFQAVWREVYKDYDLKADPFSGFPVGDKEYEQLLKEYWQEYFRGRKKD